MRETIPLNDDWKYTWTPHEGSRDAPLESYPVPFRDAAVPGLAQLDLMRDGILPDPFVGMNADHALWVEQKDWWYRKTFTASPGGDSRRALLIFHGLDMERIKEIVDIQLVQLRRRLEEKKIGLELSEAAKELLGREGFDPAYGARPLKRAIQRHIQDPLAKKLIAGDIAEGDTLLVGAEGDSLTFVKKTL